MKEYPILFSTEMVRAILDGRKSMTRRVIKRPLRHPGWTGYMAVAGGAIECGPDYPDDDSDFVKCPYGQLGDRLWVRETWYYESHMHDLTAGKPDLPSGNYSHRYIYRASEPDYPVNVGVGEHGWKPSIFMPKEAARIIPDIVKIRVERLQNITEEDAIAEGVPIEWPMDEVYCPACKGEGLIGALHPVSLGYMEIDCPHCDSAIKRFKNLWDSINTKPRPVYETIDGKKVITSYISYPFEDIQETRTYRGKPWVVCGNPWVWVVEFKREVPEGVAV